MFLLRAALVLPSLLFIANVAALLSRRVENPADDPKRTPSPPILQPNHVTAWQSLEVNTVRWNAAGLNVTGLNGTLLLGFVFPNLTRFVYEDKPLAEDFALADEAVNVILPDLPTAGRYFLTLLGDMNNTSPLFILSGTNQLDTTTHPLPATLPPQTFTTRSATITHTDVVSTVGVPTSTTSTSETSSAMASDTSSSISASPSETKAAASSTPSNGAYSARFDVRSTAPFLALLGTYTYLNLC